MHVSAAAIRPGATVTYCGQASRVVAVVTGPGMRTRVTRVTLADGRAFAVPASHLVAIHRFIPNCG